MRHKYFSAIRTDLAPQRPEERFSRLADAREAARSHTAIGGGRRVWVGTTDGTIDEFWYTGVRTHHYTRARRLIVDDPAAYHAYLSSTLGWRVGQTVADALGWRASDAG
jgi:hypothetical protein